jgi:pimeloyl-ACP methyl ester carboxylesterase
MLLLGASDKMTPVKGAQKLQEAVTNCRIKILPGVGHMMMIEEPRQTLNSIADFLNEAS